MFIIKYTHIKALQHDIGNGITDPKIALSDDDKLVVVKLFNGPESNIVLFNEYFCYRLAILCGLPMPISGICLIDDDTVINNDSFENSNYGYGFYSSYVHKTAVPIMESIIPLIRNKNDFRKILLFDHIIFNTDRNIGNLLVKYSKNGVKLYAIDHTHVFINQALWDAQCLLRGVNERDYLSDRVIQDNNETYEMFFKSVSFSRNIVEDLVTDFKEKITRDIMIRIIDEIPSIWLPSERDLEALVNYIEYRVAHLEDICITIDNRRN